MPNAASFEPRKSVAKKVTATQSLRTSTDFTVWREHDAKSRELEERIATALAADELDSAVVEWLAHRDRSPMARRVLCPILSGQRETGSLCADLLDVHLSDSIRLWRCAQTVGVVKHRNSGSVLARDVESLVRASKSPRKGTALALCGLNVAPWPKLNREERAAVLLHRLCRRLQRGIP